MARGEWGGDSGKRGLQELYYKGHMDKTKGEGGGDCHEKDFQKLL